MHPFIPSNRSVGALIHKQIITPLQTRLCSNRNILPPNQVNVSNGGLLPVTELSAGSEESWLWPQEF